MKVFRIERQKYLHATLSGIGAALSKGFRWNSENTRLVYTSQSRALAYLEVSVHLDVNMDLPNDRFIVELEIPNDLKALEVRVEDLPFGWDSKPPIFLSQIIGDDFVRSLEAPILKVPSSIVPEEFNYLINPLHPESERISVIGYSPLRFDRRLKK